MRETINQSMNSAYSDKSCYRPCTLDYELEPDVDPSVCVSSLYGGSPIQKEEEDEAESRVLDSMEVESVDCRHQMNRNTTRLTADNDDGSEIIDNVVLDQCQPFNLKEQLVMRSRVTNGCVSSHFYLNWRWRTSVLPYTLLLLFFFHFIL